MTMGMQANDETMPDATPYECCGACDHWSSASHAGLGQFALGLCYVRRGEVPVYSSATKACDVEARGEILFKLLQVPA